MEASSSQINNGKDDNSTSSAEQVKKIYEALKDNPKVNIFGSPGVGKTGVAKRVSDRAIKENLCDLTLWVFMCKDNTKDSLSLSIARQLYLLPSTQEWEDEDDNKDQNDDQDRTKIDMHKPSIQEKINRKLRNNKILLILDDFLDDKTETETKFWSVWTEMFQDNKMLRKTVIVSRLRREDQGISFEVEALTRVESESLLRENLNAGLRWVERIEALAKKFIEKSSSLTPRAIIIIAKVLNYFGHADASEVSNLEKELEEASNGSYNVNKLLCHMHKVLPIGVLKDLWWRGTRHFYCDSGSVRYNELITYWIMEGYLGVGKMKDLYHKGHGVVMELIDCGVLKQQEDGYVFMDKSVINIDDLYQCVDKIASLGLAAVFTSDGDGFGRITHEDGMLKTPRTRKEGKTRREDNEEKTREEDKEGKDRMEDGQDLLTLLLDGTHFSEQVMTEFLESEKKLQVLALFNPTIESLPNALNTMDNLRVLVLRGCEFLNDVKLPLHGLQVLEISGARSLRSIRSDFFKDMVKLQSLNLSGLQIRKLPQAIYDSLVELRWLIVKDCQRLRKLESLAKLVHLTVIDFSGNIDLEAVDKNFLRFTNLQSLNLSKTKVPTTPLLKNIETLTHLLCRDCKSLGRLRGLTSLTSLQTIDLSGSTDFEEFHDSSLASLCSLRTLNLSGTKIDRLPSNIANPRYLYLKSCLQLEQLSHIKSIVDLEVLDVSGSKNLKVIEDGFFDVMTRLRVLNLSETEVEDLPSFSKLSDLRELILSRCSSLQRLPSLEFSKKLEVLDASKCGTLVDIENPSFEGMTRLQKLDFSGTKIKSFPSVSSLSIHQLILSNCTALENLELNVSFPNLEELNLSGITSLKPNGADFVKDSINLRILNLSHTNLKQLPSTSKLINLTHLSLAGCEHIETETELDLVSCTKLQVLDLSRSSIKCLRNLDCCKNLQKLLLNTCSRVEAGFPEIEVNNRLQPNSKLPQAIPGLSHLDYLVLPNIDDDTKGKESRVEWNICQISDINKPPFFLSGTQFLEVLMKDLLLEGPLHLCAIPVKVEGEIMDRYLQRKELIFGDVYLQTPQFFQYKQNWSLQIRGFKQFPKGIEMIIKHIKLVFLIDNKFDSFPFDFDSSVLNELNGCWIERCDEMVTIFKGDFLIPIENLGISNNHGLKTIYKGKLASDDFSCLKSLYLDHCPNLSHVFPSTWLPRNLEVLQIKYCDKLVSLFETEGELTRLETLHLWELPELENIGLSFPSLRSLKIWECPKVKQLEDFDIAEGLKTLWIAGANTLKNLNTKNDLINLETLKLESCPMLEYVVSSCSPLRNIEMIEIRSCEKLQTLFTQLDYDGFPFLKAMYLEDLPLLKKIGTSIPSRVKIHAFECPDFKFDGTTYD